MTWQIVIAGASGAVGYALFSRLRSWLARRVLGRSENFRKEILIKIDTASLPEIARAVETEIARRQRLLVRTLR